MLIATEAQRMTQDTALALLKAGKNVFLTGSAGAGKTYVLNQYIQYLKDRKVPTGITASTGIAATHLNGMTIHAWSGIGVRESLASRDLVRMKAKKYLNDHLTKVKVLIIDEISMLHKNQLDLVDQVLRFFKNRSEAFGGIQVIFCGDFFQLPPVGNHGETSRDKFAFMSPAWLEATLSICYLTEQHRQSDNSLNHILNEVRNGEVSQEALDQLKSCHNRQLDEDAEPTRLFTHNMDVDRLNAEALQQLPGPLKRFDASTKGNEKLLDTLKNSVLTDEHLHLKVGAKVMFVKNNYEKGYVNGTLGVVERYNSEGNPVVKIRSGEKIHTEQEQWTVMDDSGKTLAAFNQIPIRLAWAITVHKSQGMTLDAATIDLSKTFERGQGYVALSRLQTLESLSLSGLNDIALEVDSLALKADKRFRELSAEAEKLYDAKAAEELATLFMSRIGGLTDPAEIEKNRKKKRFKKSKKSTYEITKELLGQGKSAAAIADERGMAFSTVVNHLVKLQETDPKIDLSACRPSDDFLDKVRPVYEKLMQSPKNLREDGTVSLKRMYEALGGQLGFDQIRLALLFLPKGENKDS